MIATKTFYTVVSITDPFDMYKDHITVIREELIKRYTNKCYSQMLITETDVSNISNGCISRSDNKMPVEYTVAVRATGYIYEQGSILTGMKVKSMDRTGIIICGDDRVNVSLRSPAILQYIKKGSSIVVWVGPNARYELGRPTVSVSGTPFIVDNIQNDIFKLKVVRDEKIDSLMTRVIELENEHKALDIDTKTYFTNLLFPHKSEVKYDNIEPLSKIISLPKNTDIIISRPSNLRKDGLNVVRYNSEQKNMINDSYITIISSMICEYIVYMTQISTLCKKLPNPQSVTNIKIWQMFEKSKPN